MKISMIVSMDLNNGIGKGNKLIWKLGDDLKNFKNLTTNNIVIMGRKTWDSLPKKPLSNRINIILTKSNMDIKNENVFICNSVKESLDISRKLNKDVFIIGGSEIYQQYMNMADKLYITFVHHIFSVDTYFPELNYNKWKVSKTTFYKKNKNNQFDFTIIELDKKWF